MRRPNQLRLAAFLGTWVAIVAGLAAALVVHLLLGQTGRLGFDEVNLYGVLQGAAFVVTYSLTLLYARGALRLPGPALLSFGLLAPPSAARAAEEVPVVEATESLYNLMGNRIVVVEERGVPVGLTGVREGRISSWDDIAKVPGEVAVTELRGLLAREPLVVVLAGREVRGVITQKQYLAGLWGRR
jgi:hypothetical protein